MVGSGVRIGPSQIGDDGPEALAGGLAFAIAFFAQPVERLLNGDKLPVDCAAVSGEDRPGYAAPAVR
jgi:hypothetical protein